MNNEHLLEILLTNILLLNRKATKNFKSLKFGPSLSCAGCMCRGVLSKRSEDHVASEHPAHRYKRDWENRTRQRTSIKIRTEICYCGWFSSRSLITVYHGVWQDGFSQEHAKRYTDDGTNPKEYGDYRIWAKSYKSDVGVCLLIRNHNSIGCKNLFNSC